MTLVQRIVREPALALGVVTGGIGLAVLFGVHVDDKQLGGIVVFLGALMALVRQVTTPSGEVVVQAKPNGDVVAGDAAALPTGTDLGTTSEDPQVGTRKLITEPVILKG